MTTHAFANPFLANPFVASAADAPVDIDDFADAQNVSYALIPSGPAVSSEEAETHRDVVEVRVRWGEQVLSLSHLEAGKGFAIGEGGDFVLPDVALSRIVESRAGACVAVIPTGATATVEEKNHAPRAARIGEEIRLGEGTRVVIAIEAVTIEISTVREGRKFAGSFLAALASGAAACIGLSFLGHTAIVASLAWFMPAMANDDAEGISREQILMMQAMLDTSAEREQEQLKENLAGEEANGGGSTGGEPHQGEAGQAGTPKPVTTQGHMSFRGADDKVRLSRREELEFAANEGLIGILRAGAPVAGHTSPWATETQLGQDAENKLGAMFGADANDAMGYGLGLTGTGEGGGGHGAGIGIDGVGNTVGGGGGGPGKWGVGHGDKNGWGNGHGPGNGGHRVKDISMRTPSVETNGRLPAEVIQRIVRQNHGRFRLCYEAGLRTNPGLTGRIVTKFVIGRDGAVAQAQDAGSDMPSQEVVSCVVRSFGNLSFPQPEGGVAMVTYPLVLSPGQ